MQQMANGARSGKWERPHLTYVLREGGELRVDVKFVAGDDD